MRYVAGVDHLRAFAAILIVLYHGQILFGAYNAGGDRVASYVHTHNPLRAVICEGHTAVGLFMVLSGFIFSYGSRNSEIEWRGFMRNRCLRILPLMVTLAVVGAYAFPNQMSLAGLAQHALLMSNLPGAAPMGPFNLMFWTIAVEFQFYLIFPFLLRFIRQGGWRYAGALIALALVMRYISVINGANPRQLSYWTIVGRIDQFVLGILLGLHYRPSISSFRARLLTLVLCALTVIAMLFAFHLVEGNPLVATWKIAWPSLEAAVWALFIGAYLNVADAIPARLSSSLCAIGALSFSIYMTHRIVIDTLIAPGSLPHWSPLRNTVLVALPITLGLSCLTYFVIEKPFLDLRGSYRKNVNAPPLKVAA
jgi:peptidoglycan/LPS O-acetylase OafA/YrhL